MRKCAHSVYWPEGHEIAESCGLCNLFPSNAGPIPYITKRVELTLGVAGKLPVCTLCGGLITTSTGGTCLNCGTEHEVKAAEGLRANNAQSGICVLCGSGIHYETSDKKVWECADCGEKYPAGRK